MALTIIEHPSSSYAPRTYVNAAADVTAAFAIDFTTAGEKLTKKAAGEKLVTLDLKEDYLYNARMLWRKVDAIDATSLNIAGNGIYTLNRCGWCQQDINQYIYDVLKLVCDHSGINKIVSGGQTGADLAGAIAGVALGIDVVVTMPKNYIQRYADGVDRMHMKQEIIQQIYDGVRNITK